MAEKEAIESEFRVCQRQKDDVGSSAPSSTSTKRLRSNPTKNCVPLLSPRVPIIRSSVIRHLING